MSEEFIEKKEALLSRVMLRVDEAKRDISTFLALQKYIMNKQRNKRILNGKSN